MVVGHSRVGTIALAYTVQYQNDLSALVVLAPAGYPEDSKSAIYTLPTLPIVGGLFYYGVIYPAQKLTGFSAAKEGVRVACQPDGEPPAEYLEAFTSNFSDHRHTKATIREEASAGRHVGRLVPHYQNVRVPVIIVAGEMDRLVGLELCQRLHEAIPSSQLVVLHGTGHDLQFWRPNEVSAAIGRAWELAGGLKLVRWSSR